MTQDSHKAHDHCDTENKPVEVDSCCAPKKKFDWLFWGSTSLLLPAYVTGLLGAELVAGTGLDTFSFTVVELVHTMWWGILIGIMAVGLLHYVPREFIIAILGRHGGSNGLIRAIAAGILLDLCSHGILLVGLKLYERGATLGQVMAFLIASPWNSFTLTIILFALIGLKWTLLFIFMSAVIAFISGWIIDLFVEKEVLGKNPNRIDLPADFHLWKEFKASIKGFKPSRSWLSNVLIFGVKDSRMIVRWFLFGILLASLIRAYVDTATFSTWFGPTLVGLFMTLVAATIIEVCSEGSTPIAADLLTRASAPGNGFAFLMTGVSTDYTEMVTLREATGSWKTALFLPLVTVPQVIVISWIMNQF